ncbi:Acyl-CoA desaturase [Penicillium malachiteum]|uniref:Acyl-CoA desaturase n=1 Tax=Penicillium malachiteum TaxID=1324776 RepID=UPI00254851E9|nr:Acyl-CoA desaturase [Penicillium malachiteum]KAJ5713433.1 Acyl-CoA desaturase [Penicillium malachiteum]
MSQDSALSTENLLKSIDMPAKISPISKFPVHRDEDSELSQLNWTFTVGLIVIPLGGILSLLWIPISEHIWSIMLAYMIIRGLAITAGYHRLWSHRSYHASKPLKLALAIVGAGAGQGSIKFWCRGHRAHHRYVDTDKDPYNIQNGFFFAHIGWILFYRSKHEQRIDPNTGYVPVDTSDLKADPIVEWQRKNYPLLLLVVAYVVPTIACGLLNGDFLGGFVIVGVIGTFFVQQATFCINSFGHWAGSQPYTTAKSPRNNFFTALITFGEGYHNFHHEFPIDYRNGVRLYDFDPTKWLIWACSQVGLATNLKRFPHNEIKKGRLQRRQEILDNESKMLNWGRPLADLPLMTWEEYQQQTRTGCNLIVIKGIVHEVSAFVTEHPGGSAMITGVIGKDATEMFEGGVYSHSGAAFNLLDTMRIAVISPGGQGS